MQDMEHREHRHNSDFYTKKNQVSKHSDPELNKQEHKKQNKFEQKIASFFTLETVIWHTTSVLTYLTSLHVPFALKRKQIIKGIKQFHYCAIVAVCATLTVPTHHSQCQGPVITDYYLFS